MSTFVNYGGTLTLPAPVVCENAVLYGFLLPADLRKLTDLCNRVFQTPSKSPATGVPSVTCVPIDSYVIMVFGTVGWVGSDKDRTNISAGVKECNVIFYVPVTVTSTRLNTAALFTPFIWVDNPLSLVDGREVFGYAKGFGSILIPNDPSPASLTLDAFGGNFSDHYWQPHRLIEVNRGGPVILNPGDIIDVLTDGLVPPSPIFRQLFIDWLTGNATQIFLKEFRDIPNGSNACCIQQITAARYTVTKMLPIPLPLAYSFDVTINPLQSDPIVRDLGLQGQIIAGGVFQKNVLGGFRIETSFRLGDGQVVFP